MNLVDPQARLREIPVKLAEYLTREDTSQKQMAFHLYKWVTSNITYDTRALRKKKPRYYSVKQTLRRKKGICYQYSELYEMLCRNAGISTHNILGYTRGNGYMEGDLFYESDHSWNGVKLDSTWYLVDPTWGSGALVQKKRRFRALLQKWFRVAYLNDRYKFIHQPDDRYFMADPKMMIEDHMPVDSCWQLLDYMVSLTDYESSTDPSSLLLSNAEKPGVTRLQYGLWLSEYEFLSALQFEAQTAKASFHFNNRNRKQLGYSAYNRAVSGYLKYQSEGDEKVLVGVESLLKESVSQLNRQKRQAHLAAEKMQSRAKRGINDLERPNALRSKKAAGLLKTTLRIIEKNNLKRRHEGLVSTYNDLNLKFENRIGARRKRPVPGKVKKPELVRENHEKILVHVQQLKQDPDSLERLYNELEQVNNNRLKLLGDLMKSYKELELAVDRASGTIQNDQQFSEILTSTSVYESKGRTLDSLKRSLDTQTKRHRALQTRIKQTVTSMQTRYQQVLKMVVQNRQFSESEYFDRAMYRKFDRAIGDLILFRIKVSSFIIDLFRQEVVLYRKLSVAIRQCQLALRQNRDFVALYEKKWIGTILRKKLVSNYQCDRIIALSRRRLSKLP